MFFPNTVEKDINYKTEIERLRKEMNAIILAHYYQEPEIQDIADFIGDSLALAKKAEATDADVIVFCGVHFMAETAKILNPNKLVLLPDLEAGCSLADSCPAPLLKKWKNEHPDHMVVSYINCSTGVKALSDIIVTSSNAKDIVDQLPKDKPILFTPDRNLGRYIIKETGRDMDLWEGTCVVHETFSERKILALKADHPDAKLIAHPECEEVLLRHADFIGSTGKLLRFIQDDSSKKYIVATEPGILHEMKKLAPEKTFIEAPPEEDSCSCNNCPYMKLNTMEKLYVCMRDKQPTIELDEDLRQKAYKPLEKMLGMS